MSGKTTIRRAPAGQILAAALALVLAGCGEEESPPPPPEPAPVAESARPAEPPRMLGEERLAVTEPAPARRRPPDPMAPMLGRWAASPQACASAALTVSAVTIAESERICAVTVVAARERVVDMLAFLDSQGAEVTLDVVCPEPGHTPQTWVLFVGRDDPDALEVAIGAAPPAMLRRCPP